MTRLEPLLRPKRKLVGDDGNGSVRESLRRLSPSRHYCRHSITSRASEALGTRTFAMKQPFGVGASENCSPIVCSWERTKSIFFRSLASVPGLMLVTQTSMKVSGGPPPDRSTTLAVRKFEDDPAKRAPGVAL